MAVVTRLRRVSGEAWLLAGLLLVAVLPRIPSLAQPLLERHPFRQTWTAWTAKIFHEQGIDLLHPQVPVFGPPFVLPSEFPIFQALGALVMDAGVPTDMAMRITGLATFVGCAVALWLLTRDLADRATAFVAVALFVASPLSLLWSRTSMIEYLALGTGLAYTWAGLRWRDGRGAHWWPVALALGVVSALVKPPTFVACALVLALATDAVERRSLVGWLRSRLDPRLVVLGVLPVVVSSAWLAYGDSVKAAVPAAAFLQSSTPLWRTYYYATLADRVDPVSTRIVRDYFTQLVLGRYVVLLLIPGVIAIARTRRASAWLGVLLAIALPIEIFFGAYTKHDYYYIAISAQAAMLAALGAMWLWRHARGHLTQIVVAVAVVAAVAASLVADRAYWTTIYDPRDDPEAVMPSARLIDASTVPGETLLVLGYAYNPSRLYYADRTALMLSGENIDAGVLRTIPHDRYRTLFVAEPSTDDIWIARAWHYVGARETHVYRVADTPIGVSDAYLVATDDDLPLGSARVLASSPVTVPCDFNGADVPAGRAGTLLQIRAGYPVQARLTVGYASGPVPARANVWLDGTFTPDGGTVRVLCSGAPQLVIDRVLDSALPR